ncbi:hypothetical protein Glove_134g43 [Diversispora epigaea]|uniref:Uncharacterized protein n=1 Tax=Diversispora epigaea TaxID=1348612 RepID=A0A397IXG1_9GLOM|nr:hypothetical protein Glove_134g43 [Diversispora epigaea]
MLLRKTFLLAIIAFVTIFIKSVLTLEVGSAIANIDGPITAKFTWQTTAEETTFTAVFENTITKENVYEYTFVVVGPDGVIIDLTRKIQEGLITSSSISHYFQIFDNSEMSVGQVVNNYLQVAHENYVIARAPIIGDAV